MSDDPESSRLSLARRVLQLRYWQLFLNEHLKKKAFSVPVHLAIGHEAIAVAVARSMGESDELVLSHRNVAYNLARAGDLKPILDEFALSPVGAGRGRLGSMNLANPAWKVPYSSSILGNNISVACGLAVAKQLKGSNGLTIVLSGDGAMEEGAFYEGLVFARSHNIGLLVIVENNDQSMASTIAERRCEISLPDLCRAVGVSYARLSGNDVFEYAAVLLDLTSRARNEMRPVCLEVMLAAINQHAGPTPGWPTDPKSLSLDHGLVVHESVVDPVFVLREILGAAWIAAMSEQMSASPVVLAI